MFRHASLSSCLLVASSILGLGACGDGPMPSNGDEGPDAAPHTPDGAPGGDTTDGGAPRDAEADADSDAGPLCEEVEPTVPLDPTSGAWLAEFGRPGVNVGGAIGMTAEVRAIAYGSDGSIYVGGTFTTAGQVPASNVAAWDPGKGWRALGDGLPGDVAHLAFGEDGSLYAAHAQPDSSASRISRWNGTSWSTFADANGFIYELAPLSDRLIAVGAFTEIGGALHSRVAYHDGTAWHGFGGIIPNDVVTTVSAVSPTTCALEVGSTSSGRWWPRASRAGTEARGRRAACRHRRI